MTATTADFWDKAAEKYSRQEIADPEAYERKLTATQRHMLPDMNVLEFGCGTGSTALRHAPFVDHIDATDISAAMIDIGRDKALQAGVSNIDFHQAGIDHFSAPEGSYDMVLALNLLHLVPDRAAALNSIHRLLTPGGLFVSTTPCLADRMGFLRPVLPVMRWVGIAPPVSFLRSTALEDEFSALGFEALEHWTHGRTSSLFMVARKVA